MGKCVRQLLHELGIIIRAKRHLFTHLIQQQHSGAGIAGNRLDHRRRELRLGIDAACLLLLQRLTDLDQCFCSRTTLRTDSKVALGTHAIVTLPVAIRFVEYEVPLLVHRFHLPGDHPVSGIDLGGKRGQIGLVARLVGRILLAQLAGDSAGNHLGLHRSKPDMGIDPFMMMTFMPFIAMVMSRMVIVLMAIVAILGRVVEQRHTRHLGQGQDMGVIGQRLAHEPLQLGADPDHQIGLPDLAYIGGTQREVVGRSAGWQQDFRLTHTFRDRRGNKAQGLDGGQHLHGTNRQTHRQQGSEKSNNSHW